MKYQKTIEWIIKKDNDILFLYPQGHFDHEKRYANHNCKKESVEINVGPCVLTANHYCII